MIVYPAIDLRGGQVVRLKEGDPNRQTIFSHNPLDTVRRWIDEGATWLHMVNLDGAFQKANQNLSILEHAAHLPVKIQFGGGLRSLDDMRQALDAGADRVVLGTIAVENPDLLALTVEQFGAEQISVALDARDGKITTHGWQSRTDLTPIEFGRDIVRRGVQHALFTDVRRDGSLIGSNIQETITLGRETGLQVIASGGVSSASEIQQLARSGVVAGAIIGMALYEAHLTLAEALLASKAGDHAG